jgi:hypothetical protein
MTVYRVVHVDRLDSDTLTADFRSERELGAEPESKREEDYPELLDGVCVDKTLEQARRRLSNMRKAASRDGEPAPRRGTFIAELVLQPGEGFEYEDRKKSDGKVTVWGHAANLAGAVCRIEQTDTKGVG